MRLARYFFRMAFSVFKVLKSSLKNINRNNLMEEIFEGRISRRSRLSAKFLGVNKNLFSEVICFHGYCHNI